MLLLQVNQKVFRSVEYSIANKTKARTKKIIKTAASFKTQQGSQIKLSSILVFSKIFETIIIASKKFLEFQNFDIYLNIV